MFAIAKENHVFSNGIGVGRVPLNKNISVVKGRCYSIVSHKKESYLCVYFINIDGDVMQASSTSRAKYFTIVSNSVLIPLIWYKFRNICMQ